jgi:hypothetical protein
MKRIFIYFALTCVILLTACSSDENKANKLIKHYMFESLYDFKSYEPTKTIVDTLKPELYFNEEAIEYAKTGLSNATKIPELTKEVKSAQEKMEFASSMSRYFSSSSYEDYHYKTAKREYEDAQKALNNATREALVCMYNILVMSEELQDNQTNEILGWAVTHKYRCNNRGGNLALGEEIFLIDKDFKEILHVYDTQDFEYAACVEFINSVLEQGYDKDELLAKIEELER